MNGAYYTRTGVGGLRVTPSLGCTMSPIRSVPSWGRRRALGGAARLRTRTGGSAGHGKCRKIGAL
jgi:hypothetical protein